MNQELQHNTPEQVREYVGGAIKVVEELQVPDDLRVAAFTQACTMLGAKQIFVTQPPPPVLGIPHMDIPKGRNHRR